MKNLKSLLAIAVIALTIASCSKGDKNLTNSIPSDATFVACVDVKSLAQKSNYDITKNPAIERGLNLAKAMYTNPDAAKSLEEFSKNINALGLNLKDDCYFFATNDETFGAIFSVNDAEKIKNALISFSVASEKDILKEKEVYSFEMGTSAICWDKNKLLILASTKYKPEQKASLLAQKLFNQDEKESINSNPLFAKFVSNKKDISLFQSSGSMLDALLKESDQQIPVEIVEEIKQLKDIASVSYTTFDAGEINTVSHVYYKTSETEAKYKDLTAKLTGKIKGDQLKYAVENPIVIGSLSLKGEGIYNYLEKLNLISKLQTEIKDSIDIKSIISNVDGDISFAINNIKQTKDEYSSTQNPVVFVFIDLKDAPKMLALIVEELGKAGLEKIDEKTYCFKSWDTPTYVGIKNNTLFVTNDDAVLMNIQTDNSKNVFGNLAKGNMAWATGSLSNLRQTVSTEVHDEMALGLINQGLDQIESYNYVMNDKLEGKFEIKFTDKKANSFATICQYFDKILTEASGQMGY